MRFAIWFYACKFSILLLPLVGAGIVFAGRSPILESAAEYAFFGLIFMGLSGAILGAFFTLGILKMKCPFCNRYVQVQGNKQRGMWLNCETCGCVHQSGLLGLKIVREKIDDPEDA